MPAGGLGTAALISGGMGLAQTIGGLFDRRKGKKTLDKAQEFIQQNQMEVPESQRAALGVAERAVSPRLPADDLRRAQIGQRVSQGVGAAQGAATSSSDVLSVLSNLYGQSMGAEQDLAIAGAERYDRNQAALRQELGRMADWEQRVYETNVLMPYQQMLGQAEAYQQRGAQGIGMGLNAIGGAASDYMMGTSAQNQYNDFLASRGLLPSEPTLVGAQAMNKVSRQNLPSYGYDYGEPLRSSLSPMPLINR